LTTLAQPTFSLAQLRAAVTGRMLILPASPRTIASFVEIASDAPEQLSTVAAVGAAPPAPVIPAGQPVLTVQLAPRK
jgi:hypothetical protein